MLTESSRKKAEKRKRANNFCEKDVKLLINILKETDGGRLLDIICNIGTKKEEIAFKDHAWLEVHGLFLDGGGDPTFEVETLRTKFNNIKKMLKLKYGDQGWTGVKPEMLNPENFFDETQKFGGWKEDSYYYSKPKKLKARTSVRQDKPKKSAMQYKWVDYESSIGAAFQEMRLAQEGLDITFICEDGVQVQAHKVILAACSQFLRNIVINIPHQHPFVYLKGIGSLEMEALMDFMYCGKTAVRPEFLKTFLDAAHDLEIKGLSSDHVQSSNFEDVRKGNKVKQEPSTERGLEDSYDKEPQGFIMEVETEKDPKSNPLDLDEDFDDDDDEDEDDDDDEDDADDDDPDFDAMSDPQNVTDNGGPHARSGNDKNAMEDACDQHYEQQQQHHQQADQHGQSLHRASGMDYICELCGKNFGSSAVALMVHQNRDHPSMSASSDSNLAPQQQQQQGISSTSITIIKCDHCNKVFTGSLSLKEHIKEEHPIVQIHR